MFVLLVAAFLLLQPASEPAAGPGASASRAPARAGPIDRLAEKVPELRERLMGLSPERPEAYFRLGEEVAYEASGVEEFGVARELYVRALHLGLREGEPPSLAASVCVALADIERDERTRRWLRAIAGTLDPRQAAPDWANSAPAPDEQAAYDAAVALGYIRSGEGGVARRYLDRPGVRELIERRAAPITGTSPERAMEFLRDLSREFNDGERLQRDRTGDGPDRFTLNPENAGDPGPVLTDEQRVAWLRVEAALLGGAQQSWAAQVSGDGGSPLRDPDPAEIAPFYFVDASRLCWREGGWVRCEPEAPAEGGPAS